MGQKSEAIQYYGVGVPYGQRPSSGAGAAVWLGLGIEKIAVVPQAMSLRVGTQLSFRPAAILVAPQQLKLAVGLEFKVGTAGVLVVPQQLRLSVGVELSINTVAVIIEPQPIIGLSTGNEPVYTWHAPDKQCDPRTVSRDVIVLQPYEQVWCAWDFEAVLQRNNSVIQSVVYIEDDSSGYYQDPPGAIIDGRMVTFQLSIPANALDSDVMLEIAIIDSKNNRHVVDGKLRIRE